MTKTRGGVVHLWLWAMMVTACGPGPAPASRGGPPPPVVESPPPEAEPPVVESPPPEAEPPPPPVAEAPPEAEAPPPVPVEAPPRDTRDAAELRKRLKAARTASDQVVHAGQLADVLWQASCAASVDGLCVEAKPRAKGAPRMCRARTEDRAVVARKAVDVKAARAQAGQVLKLWAEDRVRADLDAIEDPTERARRGAAVGEAVGLAMFVEADVRVEAALARALSAPRNLDFERDQGATKRFGEWVRELQKAGAEADQYLDKVRADDALVALYPFAAVQAIARAGQLRRALGDAIADLEVPASVAKAGQDVVTVFCDALAEQAAPVEQTAVEAFTLCVEQAAALGVTGAWPALCERELAARPPVP